MRFGFSDEQMRNAIVGACLVSWARAAEMTELIALAETTARDPLLGAFAVIAIGVLVSRLMLKQQPIWRAIARVVFLVLLTLLLCHNGIVSL
jgi:hypothetical protein